MKKHEELSRKAIDWLYQRGCSAFANEVTTFNGIADAFGVKTNGAKYTSYYIEAKASRSDLICNKQKGVYRRSIDVPNHCGVDFYYLIVADGVKVEDSLYPNWGVLDERGNVIRRAKRYVWKDGDSYIKDITKWHLRNIAHALVYRVYGKMYLPAPLPLETK